MDAGGKGYELRPQHASQQLRPPVESTLCRSFSKEQPGFASGDGKRERPRVDKVQPAERSWCVQADVPFFDPRLVVDAAAKLVAMSFSALVAEIESRGARPTERSLLRHRRRSSSTDGDKTNNQQQRKPRSEHQAEILACDALNYVGSDRFFTELVPHCRPIRDQVVATAVPLCCSGFKDAHEASILQVLKGQVDDEVTRFLQSRLVIVDISEVFGTEASEAETDNARRLLSPVSTKENAELHMQWFNDLIVPSSALYDHDVFSGGTGCSNPWINSEALAQDGGLLDATTRDCDLRFLRAFTLGLARSIFGRAEEERAINLADFAEASYQRHAGDLHMTMIALLNLFPMSITRSLFIACLGMSKFVSVADREVVGAQVQRCLLPLTRRSGYYVVLASPGCCLRQAVLSKARNAPADVTFHLEVNPVWLGPCLEPEDTVTLAKDALGEKLLPVHSYVEPMDSWVLRTTLGCEALLSQSLRLIRSCTSTLQDAYDRSLAAYRFSEPARNASSGETFRLALKVASLILEKQGVASQTAIANTERPTVIVPPAERGKSAAVADQDGPKQDSQRSVGGQRNTSIRKRRSVTVIVTERLPEDEEEVRPSSADGRVSGGPSEAEIFRNTVIAIALQQKVALSSCRDDTRGPLQLALGCVAGTTEPFELTRQLFRVCIAMLFACWRAPLPCSVRLPLSLFMKADYNNPSTTTAFAAGMSLLGFVPLFQRDASQPAVRLTPMACPSMLIGVPWFTLEDNAVREELVDTSIPGRSTWVAGSSLILFLRGHLRWSLRGHEWYKSDGWSSPSLVCRGHFLCTAFRLLFALELNSMWQSEVPSAPDLTLLDVFPIRFRQQMSQVNPPLRLEPSAESGRCPMVVIPLIDSSREPDASFDEKSFDWASAGSRREPMKLKDFSAWFVSQSAGQMAFIPASSHLYLRSKDHILSFEFVGERTEPLQEADFVATLKTAVGQIEWWGGLDVLVIVILDSDSQAAGVLPNKDCICLCHGVKTRNLERVVMPLGVTMVICKPKAVKDLLGGLSVPLNAAEEVMGKEQGKRYMNEAASRAKRNEPAAGAALNAVSWQRQRPDAPSKPNPNFKKVLGINTQIFSMLMSHMHLQLDALQTKMQDVGAGEKKLEFDCLGSAVFDQIEAAGCDSSNFDKIWP